VHFFGTATLSFSEGVKTQTGDQFEISAKPFHYPLVNKLAEATKAQAAAEKVAVSAL
jgi:hypothetical protein